MNKKNVEDILARREILLLLLILIGFTSCVPDNNLGSDTIDINTLDPNNGTNSNSTSMVELGRQLFWDPVLSGGMDVACVSCHHPDFAYADGRALPIGVGGQGLGPQRIDAVNDNIGLVGRNSPTILNTAFNGLDENGNFNPVTAPMFWDNRAQSLESQAIQPLLSFEEMRGHAFDETVAIDSIVARLEAIPEYVLNFNNVFGNNSSINSDNIGTAIAAFERTILATDSPFDRFQAGDNSALTNAQIRGMNTFQRVGCEDCHSGSMFSDFELHTIGVPDSPLLNETDSGANGNYEFRTPTLRNLPQTGPYFHNGVAGSLEETIRFYITARNFANNNGNGGPENLKINPNVNRNQLDNDIRNLGPINNNNVQDIIQFLHALNDTNFDKIIPTSVPSGLNPGGNIN